MPKRIVYDHPEGKYIVLPYNGFVRMGASLQPEIPLVAVKLFDKISDAVAAATEASDELDELVRSMRIPEALAAARAGPRVDDDLGTNYAAKFSFPFVLFRGERREEHGIMPTMFRFLPNTDAETLIQGRRKRELRNAHVMRIALALRTARSVSLEQARAAARHYGGSSALLDFTFSPKVAGYFAHPRFGPGETRGPEIRPIGIIYCLRIEHLTNLFGVQGFAGGTAGTDVTFFNVAREWRIPYLAFDPDRSELIDDVMVIDVPRVLQDQRITLRCIQVPGVRRIAAQQGMFVEIEVPRGDDDWQLHPFLWYLLDFVSDKWCVFRNDVSYQDPSSGISEKRLLPSDGPALALAGRYIRRQSMRS